MELYYSGICWFSLADFPAYFGSFMSTEAQLLLNRLKHHCSAQNGSNPCSFRGPGFLDQKQTNVSKMKFLFPFFQVAFTDHLLCARNIMFLPFTLFKDCANLVTAGGGGS